MKILAIIPARGGSKGLPGKNIINFNDKPLIYWTIEQCKKSKLINKIVVSTDDIKIAETSEKCGVSVPFLRPKELAADSSPTIDAVLHVLDTLKKNGELYDVVAVMEPTSPLRKKNDIDNAIQLLLDNWEQADAVVSLGEVHLEHPHVLKIVKNRLMKNFMDAGVKIYQRQQLKPVYFPYGVAYIIKSNALKKYKTLYPKRSLAYIIERWQCYEIDDSVDLICIDAIFKKIRNS